MAADRIRAAGEHPVVYGVATGRFAADRADYWARRYLADPAGTARTIDALSPILATSSTRWLAEAAPAAGEPVDEFASLFPPTPEQFDATQAARMAQVAAMSDADLEAELFGPGA